MKLYLFATILFISLPLSANDEIDKAPEPVIITDPATVYTKAFWRRPQTDDHLVHAERREWLDTKGNLVRWQWFLVIEPSEQTRDWLDTNPFLLTPTTGSNGDLETDRGSSPE